MSEKFEKDQTWVFDAQQEGRRLDSFLSESIPGASRSQVQKWIEAGCFLLNGKSVKKNDLMKAGDIISVARSPEPQFTALIPEDIPLNIVYEDEDLLVVDKPKGLVVHPGNGVPSGTLANALIHRFTGLSNINGPLRPGILHRLDKNTSGLLLVAKSNHSHLNLALQLEERAISRIYHALVWKTMDTIESTYSGPIGRDARDPIKMAVRPQGKPAVTHAHVLKYYKFATYVELRLETGRTHQIRVHMRQAGYPVVGDVVYGGGPDILDRLEPIHRPFANGLFKFFSSQALHAHRLAFTHPSTGKSMEVVSPLPQPMREALNYLERFEIPA